MSEPCAGCGNQNAYQLHGWYDNHLGYQEVCDQCGDVRLSDAHIPDVFWNGKPYYSEALGCELTSRSQKVRVMKEKGVRELGSQRLGDKGWIEGSRAYRRKQFEADRPKIRETLRRWKESGYAK